MNERAPPSVILEKRSYRKRRLLDGLKILPVFAVFLFFIPLLGRHTDEAQLPALLVYLFSVWLGLTILCGVLGALVAERPAAQNPEHRIKS